MLKMGESLTCVPLAGKHGDLKKNFFFKANSQEKELTSIQIMKICYTITFKH